MTKATYKWQKPPMNDQMTTATAYLVVFKTPYSLTCSVCVGSLSCLFLFSLANSGVCFELPVLLLLQVMLVLSGVFCKYRCSYLAIISCVVWVVYTKETHCVQSLSDLSAA